MDFKDIWNFIVNKHESDKNKDERVVQESWETYFSEFFGYKKLFGEIDAQRRVHIGSREREIPDIILRSDNLDLCDIELKRYCSDF